MRWDYPRGPVATEAKDERTHVKAARKALDRDEALRAIAGDDQRPLLVLRECARCNKTDDALLQPGSDNEKVLFLSRWFHCVRLPIDVVKEDHPYHVLFPSDESEHLFVAFRDGSHKHALESDTSRLELCNAMSDILAECYVKDPTTLYKDLHVLGDQLDALDEEARQLAADRSKLMEARVTDRKKLEKIDADIAAVQKKLADKRAAIEKASKIALKAPKTEAKPS